MKNYRPPRLHLDLNLNERLFIILPIIFDLNFNRLLNFNSSLDNLHVNFLFLRKYLKSYVYLYTSMIISYFFQYLALFLIIFITLIICIGKGYQRNLSLFLALFMYHIITKNVNRNSTYYRIHNLGRQMDHSFIFIIIIKKIYFKYKMYSE